jgi:hypothetical protein
MVLQVHADEEALGALLDLTAHRLPDMRCEAVRRLVQTLRGRGRASRPEGPPLPGAVLDRLRDTARRERSSLPRYVARRMLHQIGEPDVGAGQRQITQNARLSAKAVLRDHFGVVHKVQDVQEEAGQKSGGAADRVRLRVRLRVVPRPRLPTRAPYPRPRN